MLVVALVTDTGLHWTVTGCVLTNGTFLCAFNTVYIDSMQIIWDFMFVWQQVLVSTDFWDVMHCRHLTVSQKNLLPLSWEQEKTVATFSPGMLVTVYQITQLRAQKPATAPCLRHDFPCCGTQWHVLYKQQVINCAIKCSRYITSQCFSHPCVPAHWERGNGVVPAIDTKRWGSEASVRTHCNVPSGLWHSSGEMKLWGRNQREVWERSPYWPEGSMSLSHFIRQEVSVSSSLVGVQDIEQYFVFLSCIVWNVITSYSTFVRFEVLTIVLLKIQTKSIIALNKINKWFVSSGLSFNLNKPKVMKFD